MFLSWPGTDKGMRQTFGSTCHGGWKGAVSEQDSSTLAYEDVLANLDKKGISIRIASPKLVMEEAPEAYKDATSVVLPPSTTRASPIRWSTAAGGRDAGVKKELMTL